MKNFDICEVFVISAEILKGAPAADALCERLSLRVAALAQRGVVPCLCIIRIGERPGDMSYESGALKRCAKLGIEVKRTVLDDGASQDELLAAIDAANADESVHGILIFRPLPAGIDDGAVCRRIAPGKDVDGISPASMAVVYSGRGEGFYPCTAQAVVEMLKHYDIPLDGRRVAVVGRSEVIGRPAAMLLLRENATVTLCHSHTRELADVTRSSDVVVVAAGRINTLREEHFAPGQTVIDVGVNFDESRGKLCGDADHDAAERIVARISAVPGGVGAVTTTILASHVIESAERSALV